MQGSFRAHGWKYNIRLRRIWWLGINEPLVDEGMFTHSEEAAGFVLGSIQAYYRT